MRAFHFESESINLLNPGGGAGGREKKNIIFPLPPLLHPSRQIATECECRVFRMVFAWSADIFSRMRKKKELVKRTLE